MPTKQTVIDYAMYVVGKVESDWDWASAPGFDGVSDIISIGMMQCAGSNAADLLYRAYEQAWSYYDDDGTLHTGPYYYWWNTLKNGGASQLCSDVVSHHPATWEWWSKRSLTDAERKIVSQQLGAELGKQLQTAQWNSDCADYIDVAVNRGMSLDNPKPLIFFIAMYHQSPANARTVLSYAGGGCDLQGLYDLCMQNSVFCNYYNRYSTVKRMLEEWDGQSEPPDFGQVSGYSEGGDGVMQNSANGISYLMSRGNDIWVFGSKYPNGLRFTHVGGNRFTCSDTGTHASDTGSSGVAGGDGENGKAVDWLRQYLGQWTYQFGGDRWSPQNCTPPGTDCSGAVHAAYWAACGKEVGMSTADMYHHDGQQIVYEGGGNWDEVPWSLMQKGDLVLMSKTSKTIASGGQSHVALYTGTGDICIDVGSTPCPAERSMSWYNGIAIVVQRPI